MTRASYLLRQGDDPTPAIEATRAFFRKSAEASPWDVDYRVDQARTEILALRWATSKSRADGALFDAALAPLRSVLDKERANPHVYQALAEIHELRAGWLLARRQRADQDLATGLVMASKALIINPHLATALASRGALHLLRARAADREAKARIEAAREAKAALEAALREDPLLAWERGRGLEGIRGLLMRADSPLGAAQ